jgi:hypothetical protein
VSISADHWQPRLLRLSSVPATGVYADWPIQRSSGGFKKVHEEEWGHNAQYEEGDEIGKKE